MRISIDRAPLNQVHFNGERADVLAMHNALWQELKRIDRGSCTEIPLISKLMRYEFVDRML